MSSSSSISAAAPVFTARKDGYFAGGPWLDRFEFVDIGEDAAAAVGAMASKQIDREYQGSISTLAAMEKMPHVQMYQVTTAYTAVGARAPRQALRRQARAPGPALRHRLRGDAAGRASRARPPGEHHHVAPVHPEYAKLAPTSATSPRRRRCSRRPATPTASTSRSSAGRSRTGSCSPCRPWWSNGRRPASAPRST